MKQKLKSLVCTQSHGHDGVNVVTTVKLPGFVVGQKLSYGAYVLEVIKRLSTVVFLLRIPKSHVTEQ